MAETILIAASVRARCGERHLSRVRARYPRLDMAKLTWMRRSSMLTGGHSATPKSYEGL